MKLPGLAKGHRAIHGSAQVTYTVVLRHLKSYALPHADVLIITLQSHPS